MREPIPRAELPAEYYDAIGTITVDGAVLDDLVNNAIWLLLKMPPERGKVITSLVVNTKRRIDLMAEIARPMCTDPQIRKDFDDVYAKLGSAQTNTKIVHAKWLQHTTHKTWHIEVPESDETLPLAEPMPLERLLGYVKEIGTACKALERFLSKVQLVPSKEGTLVWPPYVYGVPARAKDGKK